MYLKINSVVHLYCKHRLESGSQEKGRSGYKHSQAFLLECQGGGEKGMEEGTEEGDGLHMVRIKVEVVEAVAVLEEGGGEKKWLA